MRFCSVDNLAAIREASHERSSLLDHHAIKKFNLPAGGLRSPAQKVYILHKRLPPHGALCAKPGDGEKELASERLVQAGKPSNVVSMKPRSIHDGPYALVKSETSRDPNMGGFTPKGQA